MKNVVQEIRIIIRERGIKLTKVSENTGIEYQRLNRIFNQNASLLASELIGLCKYLEISPEMFMEDYKTKSA